MKNELLKIWEIVWKFLLLLLFLVMGILPVANLSDSIDALGIPTSTFLYDLFPFLGLFLGHILLLKYFEKSNLNYIELSGNNNFKKIFLGVLLGLFWLTASICLIFLFSESNFVQAITMNWTLLVTYFVIVTINSFTQELLVHGYLFALIRNKFNNASALIITAILFSLLHPGAFESGVIATINIFGAGLIFGLIIIKFNSLIATVFCHSIWNYLGAVWFGVIQIENYPSMKMISLIGNPIIIGDKNGIETSIIVTLTIFILLVILFSVNKKNA